MVCEEECNVRVSFMHPKVPEFIENSFSWPTKDDNCYFPDLDILGRVSAPSHSSKGVQKYTISYLCSQFVADKNKSMERVK